MTDDDCGEIEYLDEDEEVVQHYVHTAPIPEKIAILEDVEAKMPPLLVERKSVVVNKRKQKTEEEDSDYDPNQDGEIDDDFDPRQRKRRKIPARKPHKTVAYPQSYLQTLQKIAPKSPVDTVIRTLKTSNTVMKPSDVLKNEWHERKKMDIQIPDYEDALCLPVRAVKLDDYDMLRLRQWNNMCLEYIKKGEKVLKTEYGETKSSTRTVVLRNVPNKNTGKIDTNIWSKTQVQNEKGEKKSEIFQSILPRYREKRLLTSYKLAKSPIKGVHHRYDVVLTKEENKGEETLVAYKPKEAVSAVYKLISKNNSGEDMESEDQPETRCSGALKEMVSCRMCAPCYQLSWRGIRKVDNGNNIPCAVCARTFVSVYNLLTHLKTHHASAHVRASSGDISKALAAVVGYHYQCRVCQKEFSSITQLRKHVFDHRGIEVFKCEVGNHMAR